MSQLAKIFAPPPATLDDMFSDARLEMIRNTVAKGAPPDVFGAMIDLAKRRGLDPLAKQIIVVKFGNNWIPMVTIDGYRAIAEQTGHYAGQDAPIFTFEDDFKTTANKKAPSSATVTVYKMVANQRCPFSATVYWEEYRGANNWMTMPRTMLAKVAESHALRKAFPSVLSGTYTREEMDQASGERWQDHMDAPEAVVSPSYAYVEAPTEIRQVVDEHGEIHDVQTITDRQMKLIHALRKDLKMDEDQLKALAEQVTGKRVSNTTRREASSLIDELQHRLNEPQPEKDQVTPARRLAAQDWYKAIDQTGIDRDEFVEHWFRYKGVSGDVEDIEARTLSNWANAVSANPKAAHDFMEQLIANHEAEAELYPTDEELRGEK